MAVWPGARRRCWMAGPAPWASKSTIIGWPGGIPTLLRPGGIAAEDIEAVLDQPLQRGPDPETPNAPGQLASHYAPNAPLRLNAASPSDGETFIAFGTDGPFSLSPKGDLAEAAANLFDLLRRADRQGRPIAVAPIPENGLGAAINDRLRRAAAPR